MGKPSDAEIKAINENVRTKWKGLLDETTINHVIEDTYRGDGHYETRLKERLRSIHKPILDKIEKDKNLEAARKQLEDAEAKKSNEFCE